MQRSFAISLPTCFGIFLSAILCDDIVSAEEPTRVFLFAGQSNMVGSDAHADRIDQYPMFAGAGQPQADVLFSYLLERNRNASDGWIPLQPVRSFGPEITFARMVSKRVEFPIAIIKSAVGGTTLAHDWNPAAPDRGLQLYPLTLELIRKSLQMLDDKSVKYRLEAVMWHQGENDMLNREINGRYGERLKAFVPRLRRDLKSPELKFFVGEISEKGIWGMDHRSQMALVKTQQLQVVEDDPLTWWVPSSHLAFQVMGKGQPHYHFGTQGQLQLGEAFAEKYLATIGSVKPAKRKSSVAGLPVSKDKPLRVFVLAGQRNMEGEDAFVSQIRNVNGFESLSRHHANIIYRYSLGGGVSSSRSWEPLGPVDYLGNFGPELSFGAELDKSIDDGIAIVKFTHSGAQGPDWFPDGSPESLRNIYPKFRDFVRNAIGDLNSRGYDCNLEGIFWHTGENDTYFHYHRTYAKWMKALIDRSRTDLNSPQLNWFISEQHAKAPWKNMNAINQDLRTLAESDAAITTIPTSHLPHERLHFGTEGTLRLGVEHARAWLRSRE